MFEKELLDKQKKVSNKITGKKRKSKAAEKKLVDDDELEMASFHLLHQAPARKQHYLAMMKQYQQTTNVPFNERLYCNIIKT